MKGSLRKSVGDNKLLPATGKRVQSISSFSYNFISKNTISARLVLKVSNNVIFPIFGNGNVSNHNMAL